jgi:hypothetical protein
VWLTRSGRQWYAECSATPPPFGVTIGGKTLWMHPEDLLQQQAEVDLNGDGVMYCPIGIVDGYEGPYILGEVFMNNVVSVFDVGQGQMRFAEKKK